MALATSFKVYAIGIDLKNLREKLGQVLTDGAQGACTINNRWRGFMIREVGRRRR
jgi:hypothetical protein